MAIWINTGTISISAGGTTVTGSGTSFQTGGTQKGDMFQAPDGREYEITNITSDTQMSIYKAYQGTNVTGSTNWDIIPTQGYVKALVDEVREYVETNNTIVDEIGTTGLSIAHGGTGATNAAVARTNLDALGKSETAADSAKLGGVESSGYARAWTVGVNLGSARWMKLCTIAGAELGQKFSVWLSGTASAYSFPADTGSARLDITLLSSGTWAGAVYRTSAGTEGLSEVRLVQTSGSGVEIWLYMGADVNVSALVIGSNNSLVTPSSEVYTAAAPAATSSAVLYNTIQQNSGTGVVQIPTRGGLQLPNVANSTVNVFDWYEEGTWTPTIYGATTAGTPSYSIQIGRYTRIGDTVHLFLYLNGTWTVAPTGNVRIGGLPFTAMTLTNYYPAQVCAIGYALATAYLYGGSGLSYLQVGRMRDVGNSTLAISFDGTNISTTNFQYHGNFVYKV